MRKGPDGTAKIAFELTTQRGVLGCRSTCGRVRAGGTLERITRRLCFFISILECKFSGDVPSQTSMKNDGCFQVQYPPPYNDSAFVRYGNMKSDSSARNRATSLHRRVVSDTSIWIPYPSNNAVIQVRNGTKQGKEDGDRTKGLEARTSNRTRYSYSRRHGPRSFPTLSEMTLYGNDVPQLVLRVHLPIRVR